MCSACWPRRPARAALCSMTSSPWAASRRSRRSSATEDCSSTQSCSAASRCRGRPAACPGPVLSYPILSGHILSCPTQCVFQPLPGGVLRCPSSVLSRTIPVFVSAAPRGRALLCVQVQRPVLFPAQPLSPCLSEDPLPDKVISECAAAPDYPQFSCAPDPAIECLTGVRCSRLCDGGPVFLSSLHSRPAKLSVQQTLADRLAGRCPILQFDDGVMLTPTDDKLTDHAAPTIPI